MKKTLTTMQKSVFLLLEDDDMEEVEEPVALQMLEEPNETTLLVPSIRSVEISKYHTCINCNRKLSQGMHTKIIKCTCCSRRMRLAGCNMGVSCQIADSETQLTIFSNVLGELLNKDNVIESREEDISEQLLELQDFKITFKDDNVVTSCNFTKLHWDILFRLWCRFSKRSYFLIIYNVYCI